MLVYVINKNGKPLMPCKPAKARHLLRDGKAKVVNREPFTIQLLWDCEENVQEVTVGIDKGSHRTGVSAVGNGEVLMSIEIHHRTDIKQKMETRRANRRQRRNRKWYRAKRFDNRGSSKRSGRLPPSIRANVEEVLRVIRQIPLPISRIVVEDVQVDIARLNDPTLNGRDYQDPKRLNENLRMATLMRDGYECQHCHQKNVRLEAHHIVFRRNGGKDTLENLLTLCHRCHERVHDGKITLNITGVSGFKDQIAQRTMQGKAHLYACLTQIANVSKVFGYETATFRKEQGFDKSHDMDAMCITVMDTDEIVKPSRDNFYKVQFRPRQTRRQYHDLPRKGKGRVRYQINTEVDGFRKGDIVRVKQKWVKQVNSIYSNGRLAFQRVNGEPPSAKTADCQLLQHCRTIFWQRIPE
ncbi:MAG: RNA-guided endonuclease IscB [Chloroflexota bacterium]